MSVEDSFVYPTYNSLFLTYCKFWWGYHYPT